MNFYDLLLFLHIAAAVIWLGGGFVFIVLSFRAERSGSTAALQRVLGDAAPLGTFVMLPASLVALASGIAMILIGPWSFGDLWLVIGLAGLAATATIGGAILKPTSERLHRLIADHGMTPEAVALMRRLTRIARIDAVMLFLVLADMVLKPTVADIAVWGGMAVVLALASLFVLTRRTDMPADGLRAEPAE